MQQVIWIYWEQGWEQAPELPLQCRASWQAKNPGWDLRPLCATTLADYLVLEEVFPGIEEKTMSIASRSDLVRIALLRKYGGIWVDSTLLCNLPLDDWLGGIGAHDFFAFEKPGEERMVSSWFLKAGNDSYIIRKWHELAGEYWQSHTEAHDYFWFHLLFNKLYEDDATFRRIWDETLKISADGPHYFAPYNQSLFRECTASTIAEISQVSASVFKLTHKYDQSRNKQGTVLEYLLGAKFRG